jgi:hypothetical protein
VNVNQSPPRSRRVLRNPTGWIAAALLLVFAALAGSSAHQHSEVLHEAHYIYAGLQNLRLGFTEIAAGTPVGLLQLSALPLLAMDLEEYPAPPSHHPILSERFLHENEVSAQTILAAARAPFILLGVALGILIFVWARALYGERAGLLALAVYAFSPTMLAQTQFAHQDFGVAAACTLACFAFWRMCEQTAVLRVLLVAVLVGFATGAALLTKYTAVSLLPTFAVVGLVDVFLRRGAERAPAIALRLAALALLVVVAALTIWVAYDFDVETIRRANGRIVAAHAQLSAFSVCPLVRQIPEWRVPAPVYLCGLSSQLFHGLNLAHVSDLAGERSTTGWWSFYLWTFLYKQPIPLLALLALRSGFGAAGFLGGERRGELRFLLAFPLLIFVVMSSADTQPGEGYILPVLPPLFVWVGGLARSFSPWPALRWVSAALLIWMAGAALLIHPHYLMYFNEIAGGPDRGWRRVVSGYDLGQDLGNLERYVAEHEIESLQLACIGCRERRRTLDLPARPLGCDEAPGWIALSVGRSLIPAPGMPEDCYDWLRPHEPVDRLGHSILVYWIEPSAGAAKHEEIPGPRPETEKP